MIKQEAVSVNNIQYEHYSRLIDRFSESSLKTNQMMNNLPKFQKSYFLTNFKVSEKGSYVRGAIKKSCPRVRRWEKVVFESLETIILENF